MADHTFTRTQHHEAGWQVITDRINAQRAKADLPDQTLDDVILEQLTSTGDREFQKDKKAKRSMTEVNTVDEAVAKLAAMGYQIQAPR